MTAADRALEVRRERAKRLTSVMPGTPMGAYMRCFWHPVAATVELDKWPVKKVRLLGEDLVLYRSDDGTLGLIADRCPHRGASLSCRRLFDERFLNTLVERLEKANEQISVMS